MKWPAHIITQPFSSFEALSPFLQGQRVLAEERVRSMALQKVLVGVVLVVAIMVMLTPARAIRGFDMGRRVVFEASKAQMEVGDLSLEDQNQVMNLDMDAVKRNLLSYDPYYNKWYGHGGHGHPPYGGGYSHPPYGGPPHGSPPY